MLRLLALLVTFLGEQLAITPIHLKPGTLTNHLGEIFLIEEILIVQYPYAPLLNTTSTIKVVSETLSILPESINATTVRKDKAPSSSHAQDVLDLLRERIVSFYKER